MGAKQDRLAYVGKRKLTGLALTARKGLEQNLSANDNVAPEMALAA